MLSWHLTGCQTHERELICCDDGHNLTMWMHLLQSMVFFSHFHALSEKGVTEWTNSEKLIGRLCYFEHDTHACCCTNFFSLLAWCDIADELTRFGLSCINQFGVGVLLIHF